MRGGSTSFRLEPAGTIRGVNPWNVELMTARDGAVAVDRRSLARDASRGLLVRIRPGVYAERAAWTAFSPEQRHIVALRAVAAVSTEPPVFSHWSAAVLHGLPVIGRARLDKAHVTVRFPADRGQAAVAGYVASLHSGEVVQIGMLQATSAARTAVDIALAAPFRDGVVVADGALHAGLARPDLEEGVLRAAGRRGSARALRVVAFARAGAESAAESMSRVTLFQLGVRLPMLQFEVFDRFGLAGRLDFWFPWVRAGGEVDGDRKYLDPALAPGGAGRALVAEKRREDRLRSAIDRLARWGWREACDPALLEPVLANAGVRPDHPRATFESYCASTVLTRF